MYKTILMFYYLNIIEQYTSSVCLLLHFCMQCYDYIGKMYQHKSREGSLPRIVCLQFSQVTYNTLLNIYTDSAYSQTGNIRNLSLPVVHLQVTQKPNSCSKKCKYENVKDINTTPKRVYTWSQQQTHTCMLSMYILI